MKENLEVFMDMWQWLITDIATISKEILDLARTHLKPDKQGYLSLPRPGVSCWGKVVVSKWLKVMKMVVLGQCLR
jgi:hypothetical protein